MIGDRVAEGGLKFVAKFTEGKVGTASMGVVQVVWVSSHGGIWIMMSGSIRNPRSHVGIITKAYESGVGPSEW